MGEIAEMMLDGTLCESCGDYIGFDTGYPGYCSAQCAKDRGAEYYGDGPTIEIADAMIKEEQT